MFSVIIPLYNKELYIERAIHSVLKQTFTEFELIIVDDGSTDSSVDIVKKMPDKRIKLFCKENGGVSSARNYGIEHVNFNFITFLDADDEWLPDYLESIKYLINKYPNCGMYGTARYEDAQGKKTIMKSKHQNEDDFIILDYCKQAYMIITSSMCVTKDIIKKVGNYPPAKVGEDVDFALRIACCSDIAYLNKPKLIYYWAMENNSFSWKIKFSDFVPYYKWYIYPYKYKHSLFLYTTKKIIYTFQRIFFPQLFKAKQPVS